MTVRLLQHTDIYWVAYAARKCTGTIGRMDSINDAHFGILGDRDKKLISSRILHQGQPHNPMNPAHESVLEHAVYTFEVEFSRTCLQEFARHRIASFSVESTRYSLKRILKDIDPEDIEDLLTLTMDADVDKANIDQLGKVAKWCNEPRDVRKKNDVIKYALPEAFRTSLILTINARSLRNLFVLRTSKRALKEIRQVAYEMVDVLPAQHWFMFEDRVHQRDMF